MKTKADTTFLKKIGERIRDLRHEKGLSQEELADIADVHRTYIGMVERGEKNITVLTVARIAKALNTPVSNIVGVI